MAQVSGTPPQFYAIGGEGVVLIAPKGTAVEDLLDEATDYFAVQWGANRAVTGQPVGNTSDYNPATRRMNPRDINTSERLTGTITFDFNADPARDILLRQIFTGNDADSYPFIRLYLTQGVLGVAGSVSPVVEEVTAIRACYFDVPEANLGDIGIEGAEGSAVRRLTINFMTNGIFTYNSVEVEEAA